MAVNKDDYPVVSSRWITVLESAAAACGGERRSLVFERGSLTGIEE